MSTLKFTKTQIKQIIEEEAQKVKKEYLLKRELRKVEAELKALNEVHPGGEMQPGPEGYHAGQKKAVFLKKGSHLIENPEEEEIMAGHEEAGGGHEGFGGNPEGMGVETLDKETVMNAIKELGHELGLTGVIDFSEPAEGEMGGEGEEEISIEEPSGEDVSVEEPAGEEVGVDVSPEGGEEHVEVEPEGIEEVVGQEEECTVAESTEDVKAFSSKDGGTDIDHSKLAPAAKGTPIIKIDNPTIKEAKNAPKTDTEKRLLAEQARWKVLAGIGCR